MGTNNPVILQNKDKIYVILSVMLHSNMKGRWFPDT